MRITKLVGVVLFSASVALAQVTYIPQGRLTPADPTQQQTSEKANAFPATLSGRVVRAIGGAPLPRTRILLVGAGEQNPTKAPTQVTAVTDQDGYFEFADLTPDQYSLILERPGWIEQGADARRPQIARAITLRPGQKLTGVEFRLIQPAVITGRVLNEDGEPIPHAAITTYRQRFSLRGRSLQAIRFETTNDLGEYRVFDLAPGSYYVSVSVRDPFEGVAVRAKGKQLVYPTVFYPNTRDESESVGVRLNAGEENRVDFNLAPVPAVHVRGTVHGLTFQSRRVGANVVLTTAGQIQAGTRPLQASTDNSGNFDIAGVTAGNYTLVAVSFGGQEVGALMGRVAVHVGETDVDNADVTIGTNQLGIEGRLTLETDTNAKTDGLTVVLSALSKDSTDEQFSGEASSPVDKDGRFHLQTGAGEYALNIYSSRAGYDDFFVKSIRFANQDISNIGTLSMTSAGGTLEIVASSRGGRIAGMVVDQNKKPIASVDLALVPEPRLRKRLDLYVTKQSDQDGNFEMRGVAPGEYLLFPMPSGTDEGAYYDPDYLAQHEAEAIAVHVEENRAAPVIVQLQR